MISYGLLKTVHVWAVVLSIAGFLFRAGLMLRRSPLADARWLRRVPHLVDTVLLAAALGMVWVGGRQIFGEAWLTGKVICLLAYIVCGALALRRAPSEAAKRFFLALALFFLANIVTIALTRDPWGLLGLLRAAWQ